MIVTLATVLIAGCPSTRGCAFAPTNGTNPDIEGFNMLFEAAAEDELGAASPDLPMIEAGPARQRVPPKIACVILKPIAAAESTWKQFCAPDGPTVISFDCGFGVMQVTSGAASYGPMLASDTTWNIGAGTQILINKWNAEQRGGPIGDSDPRVVESWYYAVWAYNGFTFGNNPDNPQHPPNRPPFNGANGLSRGNYPYQEIVWGYLHNPLGWRTAPRYVAVPVTYPAPGQVGMTPGPLPKLEPEHISVCKEPCADGDCPFELIIDDVDPGFTSTGTTVVEAEGGYDDRFLYAPAQGDGKATARARWAFMVPEDRLYVVSAFVPANAHATAMNARYRLWSRGATIAPSFDQARAGGFFYPIGEGKLLAGVEYEVVLDNATGEAGVDVAFDAVRIVGADPLGTSDLGGPCGRAADCVGDLVCVDSMCTEGCEQTGCVNSSCNAFTGLCDDTEPTVPRPDAGVGDVGTSTTVTAMPPDIDESCGCTTSGRSRGPWAWLVILAAGFTVRRRGVWLHRKLSCRQVWLS